MKRLFAVLTLVFLLAVPAFALSDAEYLKMKKNNAAFARADKNLTRVWNKLKKELDPDAFDLLQEQQREWIKTGRDEAAQDYIDDGYSRVKAYTQATNDRAEELPEIAQECELEIQSQRMKRLENGKQNNRKKKSSSRVVTEEKYDEDEDDDDDEEDEDDPGDVGEIEEERFDGTGPEGNYTRKGAFMTVIITDKDTNEAEITVSLNDPEATWSARGWIEDNVLELSDDNYSRCQATLTFSGNKVKFEATKSEDWQEVLGVDADLSGTYTRSK